MAEEPIASAMTQVVLAEFSALRQEIQDRSGAANTLLNLNITATGTVAGLVLSQRVNPVLLLLLPFLSSALGLLYLDQALNIKNIGAYIKEELKPRLATAARDVGVLAYEERIDEYERRIVLRFLPWGLPVTILFSFPALAALFSSLGRIDTLGMGALWVMGMVLTGAYFFLWGRFVLLPFAKTVMGRANSDASSAGPDSQPSIGRQN